MPELDALRGLVRDLFAISPRRVYAELCAAAAVTWACHLALIALPLSWGWVALFVVGTLALYRGLSFIHEVAHLDRRLKRFRRVYNLLFGFPFRMPAYTLLTHRYHHGIRTFGTSEDPEYDRWTDRSPAALARPFVVGLFYPVFLTLRVGLWPFVLRLLSPRWTGLTYRHASTFVMNVAYERPLRQVELADMKREDTAAALWVVAFSVATLWLGVFADAFLVWCAQVYVMSLLNTYRALVAHRYQAHRSPVGTLEAQLRDSVTIEGSLLSELWAPNALRFHSTHHLFPQIPYYNLPEAHRRLKAAVDGRHPYAKTLEPSFTVAFRKLAAACAGRATAGRAYRPAPSSELAP